MAEQIGNCCPIILPKVFSEEGDFSNWIRHFESVTVVNVWEEDSVKLQWLNVRVTRKAHMALLRVYHETYQWAKEALRECFNPPSKRELYKVQLQCQVKQDTEKWGDFGDELWVLVNRAYPDLQDEARESIALTRYLDQIKNHQIAFGVRQQCPKSLVEAVRATFELESRHTMCQRPRNKKDPQHTSVLLFTGTVKLLNSAFRISKTSKLISTKFIYFLPYIYTTSHIQIKENPLSTYWDICSWKLPDFLHIFLLLCTKLQIYLSHIKINLLMFQFLSNLEYQ